MDEYLNKIKALMSDATTRAEQTAIPGLHMISGDVPTHQLTALYQPMIGFTVQGTKVMNIGGRDHRLAAPCYYVLPIHLPATAVVFPAADGCPYMSLGLEIQSDILRSLLADVGDAITPVATSEFGSCDFDEEMLSAWHRLLSLTTTPRDIPALAGVYQREVLYRVLTGPHGDRLRQLGYAESNLSRIAASIEWLRANFKRSFEVATLAKETGMSATTFHRQFKNATGVSPVQFQKQLRLLDARKLLAFEGFAVSNAAYEVGYESASQFNREYSRFFGRSPSRDADELRKIESARAD